MLKNLFKAGNALKSESVCLEFFYKVYMYICVLIHVNVYRRVCSCARTRHSKLSLRSFSQRKNIDLNPVFKKGSFHCCCKILRPFLIRGVYWLFRHLRHLVALERGIRYVLKWINIKIYEQCRPRQELSYSCSYTSLWELLPRGPHQCLAHAETLMPSD